MNVLRPGTLTNSGQTATYFYNERGDDPARRACEKYIDFSTERPGGSPARNQAGFKGEIFNLTNNEEKIINNNVAWCGTTANAACATAVDNFGKATARGSFLLPRRFRFSLIYRF